MCPWYVLQKSLGKGLRSAVLSQLTVSRVGEPLPQIHRLETGPSANPQATLFAEACLIEDLCLNAKIQQEKGNTAYGTVSAAFQVNTDNIFK